MSVKVQNEALAVGQVNCQARDSYGLPVQENSPRVAQPKQSFDSPRGKAGYGIRVPILRDLDGQYIGQKKPTSCRFDIVEKVTTVIKPGTFGVSQIDDGSMDLKSPKQSDGNSVKRVSITRQPTFHSTYSSDPNASILEKIGPYHWNSWVKSSKDGDARDVLYRNTYCQAPEQVRYRTLTLPRISTAPNTDRPWTVAGDEKPIVTKSDHGEYNKVVTIVPQQPRGTIVRFREYMKPTTYASDGRALAVKRFSRIPVQQNDFSAVQNGFPLIRNDYRKLPRKTERPLKFENSRYNRKSKGTLYSKQLLPAYKNAFDRDYSSADTFKEYLDSLQHTAKANTPGIHSRDGYAYRNSEMRQSMNYHNEVLRSVSDVNQPDTHLDDLTDAPHEISVDIRKQQKPETGSKDENQNLDHVDGIKPPGIDNLSSVHGSVVRAHSEVQSVTVPFSSSVVDGKTVVKIPGIVAETDNVPVNSDTHMLDSARLNGSKDRIGADEGSLCPTNTPNQEI